MTITPIVEQMAEMERLALAATPGEWKAYDNRDLNDAYWIGTDNFRTFAETRRGSDEASDKVAEDAKYIIAAQPKAVLAILAHVRAETARADAAERDRDAMRETLSTSKQVALNIMADKDTDLDNAAAQVAALERERESDKATITRLIADNEQMTEALHDRDKQAIFMCQDITQLIEVGVENMQVCENCNVWMTHKEAANCGDVYLCPQQAYSGTPRFPNDPCYRQRFWRKAINGAIDLNEHFAARAVADATSGAAGP